MTKTSLRRKFLYFLYLFIVVFVLLEIVLRIYNPFQFRIRGNQILLPINQKQVIKNTINPKLDSVITNTRNGLGFRGPEKPVDWDNSLTIITVGGSTTECHFLSDNKTWPFQLEQQLKHSFKNLWLNNAGFDGHSSFGHQVLLNDHLIKIKPKMVLFYAGVNDVENDQPTFHDELNRRGGYSDLKHYIFNNSEVLNVGLNLVRSYRAQKLNNTTDEMLDLKKATPGIMTEQQIATRKGQQQKYLDAYKKRLTQLIDTCKQHGILPVFMTQAILLGQGVDSLTGVNLETVDYGTGMNGRCLLEVLELYNDVMRQVCAEKNIPVIDLAKLMPKNSLYYYDAAHFTNAGAEKVAEMVAPELKGIIAGSYKAL
jgi:lysophospholipase L1-like esterase